MRPKSSQHGIITHPFRIDSGTKPKIWHDNTGNINITYRFTDDPSELSAIDSFIHKIACTKILKGKRYKKFSGEKKKKHRPENSSLLTDIDRAVETRPTFG